MSTFFGEHAVLIALICGAITVIYGLILTRWVLSKPDGDEKMREIAAAIQEGASAYLSRQYRTVAAGTLSATISTSPYVSTGVNYGSGFSFSTSTGTITDAAATTLVTSPLVTACFGCHDSPDARSHFVSMGGASLYAPRSTALGTNETCLVCHGPGRIAAIMASHSK